jgi:hypothetical protein
MVADARLIGYSCRDPGRAAGREPPSKERIMNHYRRTPQEQVRIWRVILNAIGWILVLGFLLALVYMTGELIDSLKGVFS